MKSNLFSISHPPHLHTTLNTSKAMWYVSFSLFPVAIFSVINYGIHTAFIIIFSVFSAILAEIIIQFLLNKKISIQDGSAFLTGLLISFNLSPVTPLWIPIIGSFFAIIIIKHFFGGLGGNIFNPALAARAFLVASWPTYLTAEWKKSIFSINFSGLQIPKKLDVFNNYNQITDTITSATPLSVITKFDYPTAIQIINKKENIFNIFIGNISGCIGETSSLLLLCCGLFLIYKNIIRFHIPIIFISTVFILTFLYNIISQGEININFSLFHIFSGGLFLGAFYMATDWVTSPVHLKGKIIYAIGCGVITTVIRLFGALPEGVSYSILLMNAFVPLIDKLKPKKFAE